MTTKYNNVIVFGPTGATGSAAAIEAAKRGAKVWLAMRDTSKDIPGLNKDDEKPEKFERVEADLCDPESVTNAIRKSGAKAAYVYMIWSAGNAMKATIEAMKAAGVEYVVFLSSFTLKHGQNIRTITPDQIIPYAHAAVEISLEDVGLSFTALRPGSFAYNTKVDREQEPWKAVMPNTDRPADCIVMKDIGRVGGAVLVDRPSEKQRDYIYLYGPKLLTRDQQLQIIEQVTGKMIERVILSPPDYIQHIVEKMGYPLPVVKYLVNSDDGHQNDDWYGHGHFEEGVENIRKFSGHEPTTFEEFAKDYYGS